MATIRQSLSIAVSHHKAGRWQTAEQIYRQILAVVPDQPDAWHLLGVVTAQLGSRQEGLQCIRRALALRPDFPEAYSNLGNTLLEGGELEEAIGCYRRALELRPDFAIAHNSLGNAFNDQGKLEEAAACYRRALELTPNYADAHYNLGNIFREQRRFAEAVACYQRALQLKPDFARAHNNLGAALHETGYVDEAAASYRRALELNGNYPEAHNNLGSALREQGKLDEALAHYRRALELRPAYAEVHNNLGILLRDQGKADQAVVCCRRAIELVPGYAEAYANLGNALGNQGKLEEAVACYRRAIELKPDYAEAHNNLGAAFQDQGKLDQAIDSYRQVVQLGLRTLRGEQRHPQGRNVLANALVQVATLLRTRCPQEDQLLMRQLLAERDLPDAARASLRFGLALLANAQVDYGAAAEHLVEANAARLTALKMRQQDFQPAAYHALNSELISVFTPELFARTSGLGLATRRPVFIVGLPRSGTTLVEQILASHGAVFGAGELPLCGNTFESLPQALHRRDTPVQCLSHLDPEGIRYLAQQHLEQLQALDQQALRIVDKMPENYRHLGLMRILFPQAQFIHCRRDLRDVALSCWMTNFTSVPWACDRDQIISFFEEYLCLMDHWQKVLPGPPLDVDYEELVADTEGVARRIMQWCGLEWEPSCLRFYETQRPVRTASAMQVRQPIYKSSVGRWQCYQPWLGALFSRAEHLEQTWRFREPAVGGAPPGAAP